jgi:hypothetical protein
MQGSWLIKTVQSIFYELAATHTVAAVQAFITCPAADRDMPAGITSRRVALHAFRCCIYRIKTGICIHILHCTFCRYWTTCQ